MSLSVTERSAAKIFLTTHFMLSLNVLVFFLAASDSNFLLCLTSKEAFGMKAKHKRRFSFYVMVLNRCKDCVKCVGYPPTSVEDWVLE